MSSNDQHWTEMFGDDATSPADASTSRPPLDVLLSAYLDDPEDLTPEQHEQVVTQLATDPEAQRTLAELSILTTELRNLPEPSISRTFHLTPADVDSTPVDSEPPARKPATAGYLERLRQATAVAAVLFVAILAADLAVNSVFTGPTSSGDNAAQTADREIVTESAELSVLEAPEDSAAGGAEEAVEESASEALDEGTQPETMAGAAEEDAASDAERSTSDQDATAATEDSPLAAVTEVEGEEAAEGAAEDSAGASQESESIPEEFAPTPTTSPFEAYVEPGQAADESALVAPASVEPVDQPTDERNYWRAAEFGLAVAIALLIALIIFLPKFNRVRRS